MQCFVSVKFEFRLALVFIEFVSDQVWHDQWVAMANVTWLTSVLSPNHPVETL